jgi:hypothetical protein
VSTPWCSSGGCVWRGFPREYVCCWTVYFHPLLLSVRGLGVWWGGNEVFTASRCGWIPGDSTACVCESSAWEASLMNH